MHILFLSDNFPPEVNAPATRTFEHCREWVAMGHQVTVITCAPNFPKGKVFPDHKNKIWQSEMMDGIRVIRVWSYISANQGFVRRILDYLSFMVTSTIASVFVKRANVVIGTSPQFFTVCAAWVVSLLLHRAPFIFELRDLWPESIKTVGAMKSCRALDRMERLELFLYRKAAMVVSVTHSFKRNLISRGIDPNKIQVITNGVDTARFGPREKDAELVAQYKLENKFVVGYIGTLGMAHALETLLLAAARLQESPEGTSVQFLLLGDGAKQEALIEQAKTLNLKNVLFLNTVPKQDVVKYWSLLDASIIHLKNTPLFSTVIPSKLFESMGMGIPILHGVSGESADIVTRTHTGLVFEAENVDSLCESLLRLKDDRQLQQQLRENCLVTARRYDRQNLAREMGHLLERWETQEQHEDIAAMDKINNN